MPKYHVQSIIQPSTLKARMIDKILMGLISGPLGLLNNDQNVPRLQLRIYWVQSK